MALGVRISLGAPLESELVRWLGPFRKRIARVTGWVSITPLSAAGVAKANLVQSPNLKFGAFVGSNPTTRTVFVNRIMKLHDLLIESPTMLYHLMQADKALDVFSHDKFTRL